MSQPLILVAAGGLARETAEAARAAGQDLLGFVDDDPRLWGGTLDHLPVLGGLEAVLDYRDVSVVLCAGQGIVRARLAARLHEMGVQPDQYVSVVHPSVSVPQSCKVGIGSVLLGGTVLTASVSIGSHVVCYPHVTLTHDDALDDFVTLCSATTLGGGVRIRAGAYVGMSTAIREHVVVGAGAVIGMGAVVLQDVPQGETWAGVPARALRASTRSPIEMALS
jgi:sugar O-acyltransferase (sialic acid O-acetyltransferase NeuD family)